LTAAVFFTIPILHELLEERRRSEKIRRMLAWQSRKTLR